MSLSVLDHREIPLGNGNKLNPSELKIDLFCHGAAIDDSCRLMEEGRPVDLAPEGLAGGLEMILPGEMSELWVNVPIREQFSKKSPYRLSRREGGYFLTDSRNDRSYGVRLAPRPDWYMRQTSSGAVMSQIGILQGTVLWVDLGPADHSPRPDSDAAPDGRPTAGDGIRPRKSIGDVVETAAEARKKSGITMVLLREAGPEGGGIARLFPYIKALKRDVGILVVLEAPPEDDLQLYDQAYTLGVDHFTFRMRDRDGCGEDRAPSGSDGNERFPRTGKSLAHCVRLLGKGRTSGQLSAGNEPLEDTRGCIDYLTAAGAIPLVKILRPAGGGMQGWTEPTDSGAMIRLSRHVYQACRSCHLPIGMVPNVHLSTLVHPMDTLYLAPDAVDARAYQNWILTMQQVMRPYFQRRMRKHADRM